MSPTQSDSDHGDQMMIGFCPNHEVVGGDAIEGTFPNPMKCAGCGEELDSARLVDQERAEQSDELTTEFEE